MLIDYKNYHVFTWTEKQIKKHYSENICNKYFKILAYLYQNGYDINCDNDTEIEEQLSMWNYFQDTNDFNELLNLSNVDLDYSIGKKIISEEFYDIVKNSTFFRKETNDPVSIKNYATIYWKEIEGFLNRVEEIFYSKDLEVAGAINNTTNLKNIKEKIEYLEDKVDDELKVITWLKSVELCDIIYSIYIKLTKVKTDTINVSKASNLNDEIYGGIGGFNPNNGEIKCIIGSAVWDVKTIKTTKSVIKIKTVAGMILNDTIKTGDDDEYIQYLEKWYNGIEKDNEKARRIVICSLLHGILTLLSLKHNINFLDDKKNSERAEAIKFEFIKILEYCGIDKEYLL